MPARSLRNLARKAHDGAIQASLIIRRRMGFDKASVRVGDEKIQLRISTPAEYAIARTGLGEFEGVAKVLEDLPAHGVLYDIGAGVGLYTLVAAKKASRVIAFEPAPANFEALTHNARMNGLTNILMFPVAIGDEPGEVPFFISGSAPGTQINSLCRRVVETYAGSCREIQARIAVLDDFIRSNALPLPDVVKIDVEGAEGCVLRGMRKTLAEAQPTLHVEVHPGALEDFGDSPASIVAFLEGIGYGVARYPKRDLTVLVARYTDR